jgi:acyl-CoA reductase-like NAD-dependent aldehyde dehydrogenase
VQPREVVAVDEVQRPAQQPGDDELRAVEDGRIEAGHPGADGEPRGPGVLRLDGDEPPHRIRGAEAGRPVEQLRRRPTAAAAHGSVRILRHMATVEHDPAAAARNGAGDTIPVTNPATGAIVTTIPAVGPEQVGEVVARARAAQPAWAAMGFEGRARILRRAQKWVVDHADRIIDTIVSETGKTREDAQLAEVSYAAHAFGFWAKRAPEYLADEKVHSTNPFVLGRKLVVRYEPVGVVGIIGPWNYPLTNSFGDAIPALAAGNTVVLKPSEVTPLTSLLMEECMRDCGLPPDVYTAIPGYGATGAALIEHVDMVMFTGSTATGKKIMATAAERLIPVSLELGGKDPMIVLDDADLERAANAAVHYSMQNAGQTCISVERLYVQEPVYDEFVAKVTEKVRGLRQGVPGAIGTTDVGAITFPPQLDVIESHVEDARAKGATIVTGGHASVRTATTSSRRSSRRSTTRCSRCRTRRSARRCRS